MVPIFFVYFSLVSIVAGVFTVALRSPVHCGLALLTLLLHVAGLFVLLNAEFLFAVQIIVYAGAILVLYLFVLMLLNLKSDERYLHSKYVVMLFAAVAICGELVLLMMQSPFSGSKGDVPAEAVLKEGASYAVGIKMFSEYLLAFEIVGVFLLGAIIGAIVLAKTPVNGEIGEKLR
ncbi:MAG TPA: NADH-quinone oxidoreductase subunit J [Nitrospiraceae bacterium]|nr:NADH-quinone oxidoreductase subunit J [Nitrospiraceae bacterium]